MLSLHDKSTLVSLRYFLGGLRPKETTHQTLSYRIYILISCCLHNSSISLTTLCSTGVEQIQTSPTYSIKDKDNTTMSDCSKGA